MTSMTTASYGSSETLGNAGSPASVEGLVDPLDLGVVLHHAVANITRAASNIIFAIITSD